MKILEVLNCSFSAWYPKFKDHTIKSHIIPLPHEFVDYLLADNVILPEGTHANCSESIDTENSDNRDTEDVIDWNTEDILTPVAQIPSFPEFETFLKKVIKRLGGQVFPKLNWSAPKDATWISFNRTLKCTCPSDVYLLLKSSDFISHDLTQPFKFCEDDENLKNETSVKYELVLRQWQELNPADEFRCFVKHDKLIGIAQRHIDMHYQFIQENREDIVGDISAFFYHIIKGNFPDKNYCFDVYRRSQGKLLLLDFNPFGCITDALLFTWEELESADVGVSDSDDLQLPPVLRCLESPSGVRCNPYSAYAFPKDFSDISSGEDPAKLMELLQLKVQYETNQLSDDDDDEHTTQNISI